MFKNLSKGTKIALIIAGAFVAFVVLPFISWIITDEGIIRNIRRHILCQLPQHETLRARP